MKLVTRYVTKFALTQGIIEIQVDEDHALDSSRKYLTEETNRWSTMYRKNSEIFSTRDEAVANAEKRRAVKLASIAKTKAKIESLTF